MHPYRIWALALTALLGLSLAATGPARAATLTQEGTPDPDLIAQGEYLARISACIECHSPQTEQGQPDPDRLLAGGRPFDLGPLGIIYSQNLTPAGIGGWTDAQLEAAIRTGVSPDGHQSFPIMPYTWYNGYSAEDMTALIAYLRSVPALENETIIPRRQVLPVEQLPRLPSSTGEALAPQGVSAARGEYLVKSVMACSDCHTPIDPTTGNAQMAQFLGGGQPYEGAWGIVYGSNLTPDEETGIGAWTDTELIRALTSGIRPDGRVLVVMPWSEYGVLTVDDARSIAMYLRTIPVVSNPVPAPVLHEDYLRYVQIPAREPEMKISVVIAVAAAALLVIGGALAFAMKQAGASTGPHPDRKG